MRASIHSTLLALSFVPNLAHAEWFDGTSRAIALGDSASPDAPVTSYAYGPRAAASLGFDAAVFRSSERGLRLGMSALLSLENLESRAPLPDESLRSMVTLGAAWALDGARPRASLEPQLFEFGLGVGQHSARRVGNFLLRDAYRVDDVPFAAGGYFLGLDAAARLPFTNALVLATKLGLRFYANAFPDFVSATESSNHVADALHEGARIQAYSELGIRVRTTHGWAAILRLYLDSIDPHDDSAKPRWLGRLITGIELQGARLNWLPYLDTQAGHGLGLAVNRSELRLGVGARLYAR